MTIETIRVTEMIAFDAKDIKRTSSGYLITSPRVGRIGIQVYRGSELGRPTQDTINVYRPEAEVMHTDSMASMAYKPITNDHPPELVDSKNWRKYAAGTTGGEIARDGDFIRVPMQVMDEATIADVLSGKKELSLGYTAQLDWSPGTTPDGQHYDAVQKGIRINHLAIVSAARGGPKLAIGDSALRLDSETARNVRARIQDGRIDRKATKSDGLFDSSGNVSRCALESIRAQAVQDGDAAQAVLVTDLLHLIDANTTEEAAMADSNTKFVQTVIDGITVDVSDVAKQVIDKTIRTMKFDADKTAEELAALKKKKEEEAKNTDAAMVELKTQIAARDAELATVKKQLADSQAAYSPAKLDEMVRDRAETAAKAKTILGDALVFDGKTSLDMQRQAVVKVMGDEATKWDDNQIGISFRVLTKDAKVTANDGVSDVRSTFSGKPTFDTLGGRRNLDAHYDKYDKGLSEAYKTPAQAQ